MKSILTVMKFTIKDMIRRKSFIISTLIILLFIVIGFNIPNIINNFETDDNSKLAIVDKENIFENNLEVLKDLNLNYEIEISNDNEDEIKTKIENQKIDSAIIIDTVQDKININYIVEDASFLYDVPEDIVNALTTLYKNIQISKMNLSAEQIALLNPNFNINITQIKEDGQGNSFVMMLMSIVLFYAIYFCAFQVSSSITTEKTSKIIETLVTSTSPQNIVLGKTIGIGLVGLIQLIILISTAFITAKFCLDPELLNAILDMSNITWYLGIIIIVYFILGYFAFALLYALTGSTVSKPEDVQSANGPVAILAVASFYLSYFTMMNPSSNLNNFASMFPLSSPFCMPFRIMLGLARPIDVLISILILIFTILIIAKVAIRIYSNAILNYGSKLSVKELINIYKNK